MSLERILIEDLNAMTPEKCHQCDQVFLTKNANLDYKGVVSTFNDESYCTFSCVTKSDGHPPSI